MFESNPRPALDRAYWVEPGRLMAGSYPGDYDEMTTRRNLRELLERGIRTFVTLMQAREENYDAQHAPAYAPIVEHVAARLGVDVECQRFEIHDMSVPTRDRAAEVIAAIERSLERERPVYLHCWGGRGRTGTLVAIWLCRRGIATPENFVEVIGRLRAGEADNRRSTETAEQVEFVRSYVRGL